MRARTVLKGDNGLARGVMYIHHENQRHWVTLRFYSTADVYKTMAWEWTWSPVSVVSSASYSRKRCISWQEAGTKHINRRGLFQSSGRRLGELRGLTRHVLCLSSAEIMPTSGTQKGRSGGGGNPSLQREKPTLCSFCPAFSSFLLSLSLSRPKSCQSPALSPLEESKVRGMSLCRKNIRSRPEYCGMGAMVREKSSRKRENSWIREVASPSRHSQILLTKSQHFPYRKWLTWGIFWKKE